jgi:4-amino-4-deoxy-L-arabinose transferase-like glycosyltransferase
MKKSNLIIVFLLSFILFASFAVLKQPSNKLINDEIFYYFQAQNIQENGTIPWLSNTQPPLYATLMGFVQLTGDWPLLGLRLLSALLMALAVAAFFYWSTQYTNQKAAIVATVLFTFNVETFTLASQLYTEALFILLSILSLIFFDRYQTTQNEKDALLCWLLAGLSVLTRTTGLFLVLV